MTIDVSKIRPGDWVEFTYDGHKAAGEVWEDDIQNLCAGGAIVVYDYGCTPSRAVITSHTPCIPPEPTDWIAATDSDGRVWVAEGYAPAVWHCPLLAVEAAWPDAWARHGRLTRLVPEVTP